MVYYGVNGHSDYLAHHGIKGQKWGVRNYQNEDGSLTAAGKQRYGIKGAVSKVKSKIRGDDLTPTEKKIRARKIAKGVAIGAAGAAYAAYRIKKAGGVKQAKNNVAYSIQDAKLKATKAKQVAKNAYAYIKNDPNAKQNIKENFSKAYNSRLGRKARFTATAYGVAGAVGAGTYGLTKHAAKKNVKNMYKKAGVTATKKDINKAARKIAISDMAGMAAGYKLAGNSGAGAVTSLVGAATGSAIATKSVSRHIQKQKQIEQEKKRRKK